MLSRTLPDLIVDFHVAALVIYAAFAAFHAALAPVMFDEVSHRLVWYLGTDLGALGLIAVNVLAPRARAGDRLPWRICHGFNLLACPFNILNLVAVPEPINAVVLLVIVVITGSAVARDWTSRPSAGPVAPAP